jgi:hypothetical protein
MEKWEKVFEGEIPHEKYEMLLQNGEEKGLVINLLSEKYNVIIKFGVVSAIRILDEGILIDRLFDDQ